MRLLLGAFLFVLLMGVVAAQQSGSTRDSQKAFPGKFVDITSASGIQFSYLSSHTAKHYLPETMGPGVALFDYDNDGRLDIFFVNGVPLQEPTAKGSNPQRAGSAYWNRLYHQKPDGTFEDVTEKASLQGVGYGMGVAVGDYDNDGFEDLYVTAYRGNKLYHNNGDGTSTDVNEKIGAAGSGWSTSAARGNLDNDGETPTRNHWLPLKLVGHKSNRDAIGAEVKLVTAKGQQFATVATAGSYLSSSDKRVHSGLGSESFALSIEIRWPSSIQQTLKNVLADLILQVDEPLPNSPPIAGAAPK